MRDVFVLACLTRQYGQPINWAFVSCLDWSSVLGPEESWRQHYLPVLRVESAWLLKEAWLGLAIGRGGAACLIRAQFFCVGSFDPTSWLLD